MGNAWVGNTVAEGVHVTAKAREQGYGFAVYVGEETDVRVIVASNFDGIKRYKRLMTDEGASTGGCYGVRRDNDGKRWRVTW